MGYVYIGQTGREATKRKERRREWWGFLGLAIANLVYTLALTGTGS